MIKILNSSYERYNYIKIDDYFIYYFNKDGNGNVENQYVLYHKNKYPYGRQLNNIWKINAFNESKSKYFYRLPSDNYFSYSSFLEIAMPIEEYDDYSIIEINADSQQLLNNFVKVGEDNDFDTLIFVLNECNAEGTKINDLSSIFKDNMNIKINYQKFISLYFGV